MRTKRAVILVLSICILFVFASCKDKEANKSGNDSKATNTATESPTEIIEIDLSDDNNTSASDNGETTSESAKNANSDVLTITGKYTAVQDITDNPETFNQFVFDNNRVSIQINLLETIINVDTYYEYDSANGVITLGEGIYEVAGDGYPIFNSGVSLILDDDLQSFTIQGMNDRWVLQGWNPNCFADGSVFSK